VKGGIGGGASGIARVARPGTRRAAGGGACGETGAASGAIGRRRARGPVGTVAGAGPEGAAASSGRQVQREAGRVLPGRGTR
jgi:hypothetical protein